MGLDHLLFNGGPSQPHGISWSVSPELLQLPSPQLDLVYVYTVRTLPTRILENADTKVLITLCCAFYIFCPAQWEQMHWHETEVQREAALTSGNTLPLAKAEPARSNVTEPGKGQDQRTLTKSQSSQGGRERSLQWCPRRGQDQQWGWARPWKAAQMARMPSVWLSQCPLTPFSELIKGNGTSPGRQGDFTTTDSNYNIRQFVLRCYRTFPVLITNYDSITPSWQFICSCLR